MKIIFKVIAFPFYLFLGYYACVIVFGGFMSLLFFDVGYFIYPATHPLTSLNMDYYFIIQGVCRGVGIIYGIGLWFVHFQDDLFC
jgi:hypothetical protein